jgi:hypothetical protein
MPGNVPRKWAQEGEFIMSDCCCGGHQGVQPPPPKGPSLPSRCTRYKVTIASIEVLKADDGLFDSALEVTFTFVVNGEVQTWVSPGEGLSVGFKPIGLDFFVDVPADTSTIVVQGSGVEDDDFFDDPIIGFTHTWSQSDNWGVGAQSETASDSNITYRLNYSIGCEVETAAAISQGALVAYGRAKMKKRKVTQTLGDSVLLSLGLDRVRKAGWSLVQATDRHFVFKGCGNFPARFERKFSGATKAPPRTAKR